MAIPTGARLEKDRTGVLAGQSIPWPTFDNLAGPLLGLLGATQASAPSDDEVGVQDAEALARQEWEGRRRSAELTGEDKHGTLRPGGDGRGTTADRRGAAYRRREGGVHARRRRIWSCTAGLRACGWPRRKPPAAATVAEPERNGS